MKNRPLRHALAACLAAALAFLLVAACAPCSFAAEESASEDEVGLALRLLRLSGRSAPAQDDASLPVEQVGAVFPSLLSVRTSPEFINTGIECHMDEVCGYDPCTCGKPDVWGHCACGGFRETAPTVTMTVSDESVAELVRAFGQTWLVPVSAGTAVVSVTADLVHYRSAQYSFEVEVAPFGLSDALLVAAVLVVAAAVAVGLLLCARLAVRTLRRALCRRRAWRMRAQQLREEHPLTWRARLATERRARSRAGRPARTRKRRPFVHDTLFSLRQTLPVLVAGLAVFSALVPVSTAAVADVSVFNVNYTHEQLKYQLYAQDLSFAVNAACALYGAALALALFRFLLAKRSTTAFFSVGLSRARLYGARVCVGMLCILAGIGIPFVVSLALNCAALGLYEGQLGEFFYVVCGYLLVAAVSFALSSLAVLHAGTLFEAGSFSTALLLGPSAILWGAGVLTDQFLVGSAAGATLYGQDVEVAPSLLQHYAFANPLLFFAQEGASHQYFMALHPVYYPVAGSWSLLLAWAAVLAALLALGMAALRRRRGEQAEMAGKAPALSLVSVAVFGLAAYAAVVALLGPVDRAVALAAGALVFLLVSLSLLFGPFRGRASGRATLALVLSELAAMGAAVLVLFTGAFGYVSFVPALDEVESVEVSYAGSPSYLTEGFSGVSGASSYYYTSYRTYFSASSVDIVRSLHAQLVATAREERVTDYVDFQSTVVPYDVVLRYTLKDGGELVRYYRQASVGQLAALLALDNDEHARALEWAAITGDTALLSDAERQNLDASPSYHAYRSGYIYAADGLLNRIISLECSDQERAELLVALATDWTGLTAQQRYAPAQPTRAVLMFTRSPSLDVSSFGYSFSNAVSYVTDEWTHTMAWLERTGALERLASASDASVVESLTLQLDDPYASVNEVTSPVARYFMAYRSEVAGSFWVTQDYGALKVVEDPERIAQILPNLRTGCSMTGGYLVQAKLRGIEAYVYLYLPAESAPDFL